MNRILAGHPEQDDQDPEVDEDDVRDIPGLAILERRGALARATCPICGPLTGWDTNPEYPQDIANRHNQRRAATHSSEGN